MASRWGGNLAPINTSGGESLTFYPVLRVYSGGMAPAMEEMAEHMMFESLDTLGGEKTDLDGTKTQVPVTHHLNGLSWKWLLAQMTRR